MDMCVAAGNALDRCALHFASDTLDLCLPKRNPVLTHQAARDAGSARLAHFHPGETRDVPVSLLP